MSFTIAVAGKGGTGKTTLSGLIIKALLESKHEPILAIDADPNACLDEVLGVTVATSLGSIREETRKIAKEYDGIAKKDLLELKIAESIIENDNFDFISMGRPEGPGCYCYANNVLREVIKEVASSYPYIVIDNEAGLENLSRRIVRHVDLLIAVADDSLRGLNTTKKLIDLAREMDVTFSKSLLIVNKSRNYNDEKYLDKIKKQVPMDSYLLLSDDDEIADFAEKGTSLLELSYDNLVYTNLKNHILPLGGKNE